jgi:hypothetical protein
MPTRIKHFSNSIKDKISPCPINKSKEASQKTEPKNLRVIKAKLAQNALVELRLGFDEIQFYCKRDVQSLINVLEGQFLYKLSLDKHSCLKSISIGWKLPPFAVGPIFQRVIPILLREPIRVKHIQLALMNTPIPESCLKRIVSWSTLESLDLRSIRVLRPLPLSERTVTSTSPTATLSHWSSFSSPISSNSHFHHSSGTNTINELNNIGNTHHFDLSNDSPYRWETENIVRIVPYISLTVKTLKLIDCGLRREHIFELCEVIRRKMHGLQELSLRHNRDMHGGFDHLFSLPCIKKLDLSLCDLDPHDGMRIARAMETHLQCCAVPGDGDKNHHLQRLSLCGNYRMAETIPDIVRAAACRLVGLDCSFCDVQSKLQGQVFNILATTPRCTLQSFSMQGTRIKEVKDLLECIRDNSSLRRLVLDYPRAPFPVPSSAMECVSEAMKLNFSLCTLSLDIYQCERVCQEMEFWFELNRCGRRVLLQSNETKTASWANILAKAAMKKDINVLFWLLKHGSPTFAI